MTEGATETEDMGPTMADPDIVIQGMAAGVTIRAIVVGDIMSIAMAGAEVGTSLKPAAKMIVQPG